MDVNLKIKKLDPKATIPKYQTKGSAGFDLHTIEDGFVPKGGALAFRTGLAFEIPEGHVMLIFSRSGMGFKDDLRLANCVGVIDSDYRGEVQVKITNDGICGKHIEDGQRIAQCVILKLPSVSIEEVEDLSETERGTGGFGSTGKV